MKKCSRCRLAKNFDQYYKDKRTKDGLRVECIRCYKKMKKKSEEKDPVLTTCKNIGWNIIRRTKTAKESKNNSVYRERGIKSRIGETGVEIGDYLYKHFYDEIKDLLDKGEHPSINRIDPWGDYEKDNIEFVPYNRNAYLGAINGGEASKKRIKVEYQNGSVDIFESIKEASKVLKISTNTIRRNRDKGTRSQTGYKFYDV